MNKKGFTLIEVLATVALLSFVGVAILRLSGSSKSLISYSEKKKRASQYATYIFENYKYIGKKNSIWLKDIIDANYNINNDEVEKYFKDKKAQIRENEDSSYRIDPDGKRELKLYKVLATIDGFENTVYAFREVP